MKKQSIVWFGFAALMVLASFAITSCNKKFDEPPITTDPGLTPTHSVKALKARHTVSGAYDLITDDVIIKGIVGANDKSGNLYKQIFIQDTTGGICVLIDRASLYGDYPVGREIFIKAKGLYISDYRGLIQLGVLNNTIPTNPSFEGINTQLIDQYIVKGTINHAVTPKVVTVADLTTSMQDKYLGTLIQLNDHQVEPGDTGKTWADVSAAKNSGDIFVKSCATGAMSIDIRSSGFASFAGLKVPKGNGSVVAIYTIYGNIKQLVIRDTTDVKLYNPRCTPAMPPNISIEALKNMYTGTDVTIATPYSIKGIVISDAATGKNISNGNLVLQDGNRGIDLFFGTSAATVAQLATFQPGDSLVIDITGGTLTSYNGMIELSMGSSAIPAAAVKTAANGAGLSVVPVQMTITEVISKMATIENTMVKIVNATASPAGTYSGNKTLTDATSSMVLRTVAGATFANSALPTTCQNWVGYVSRFNADNQIYIRNPATDLSAGSNCTTGGGGGGSEAKQLTEDFETGSKNSYTAGDASLASGTWNFTDAGMFTGTSASASDIKNGLVSVRIRGNSAADGFIQSKFYVTGLKKVSFKLAGSTFSEGTPEASDVISAELKISKNGGTTWTSLGSKTSTRGTFTTVSFDVNAGAAEQVMVQIINSSTLTHTTGSTNRQRINVDDILFEK